MENQTDGASQAQTNSAPSIAKKKYGLKMNKRQIFFLVIFLAIVGVLFYFKGLFIAAIVNGKPISRLNVIQELENASGRQALDALIVKQLIETETNKAKIVVNAEDIDAEIKTLEERISKQGGTLELVLMQQGITQDQFRDQILLQKKLEKILESSIQVTDEEVNQYFEQNKTTLPADTTEDEMKNQIRGQLKNQKFSVEADKLITELRSKASIQYYVGYGKPSPTPEPPAQNPPPADTQDEADAQKSE